MSNFEFTPKLGRPGSGRDYRSLRVTRLIVRAAARQRAAKAPWRGALTRRPVAELGRGKGSLYALLPPRPGWRRVVVKARIARHGTADLAAARAHQHYIQRDGVTRDGGPGELYDRERDSVDGGAFLDGQKRDTYQFRLIVAPEDSLGMHDLKGSTRDLMAGMEQDLGTRLDWVAVDHFNTGHPHTHVIIAGHDDRGQDLVMARHYISHGIRHRSQELVTRELGPELDWERTLKLSNEMRAERWTALDRGLLRAALDNVLVVSAMPEPNRQSLHIGRLRTLEKMQLAEEKRPGVWVLDGKLEPKLRALGERGDIMATMQRVMRRHGPARAAGDFAIFAGASRASPVIGRVVEVGLADEMSARRSLIVDGLDGRIHYAETTKLPDLPAPGMIVALSSAGGRGKPRNAHVEVLSYWPPEWLPAAEAATWLDQTIVAKTRPTIHEHGFGAEVSKALVAREAWLIGEGLAASEHPKVITPKRGLLSALHYRGMARLAETLERELGRDHVHASEGRLVGTLERAATLPTQRLAVIKGRQTFTLVPWKPELAQMRGRDVAVGVRDHGQDREITLPLMPRRERQRDIGLSR